MSETQVRQWRHIQTARKDRPILIHIEGAVPPVKWAVWCDKRREFKIPHTQMYYEPYCITSWMDVPDVPEQLPAAPAQRRET